MSKAWQARKGSTARWKAIRRHVLQRDGMWCYICHTPIPHTATHPDRLAPEVHHLDGAWAGDDPLRLRPAHRICNAREGTPTQPPRVRSVEQPRRVTEWNQKRK